MGTLVCLVRLIQSNPMSIKRKQAKALYFRLFLKKIKYKKMLINSN